MVAFIMLLFGISFYKSNGKTTIFLTDYISKLEEERKHHDEKAMCEAHGRRMIFRAFPFMVGAIIDF